MTCSPSHAQTREEGHRPWLRCEHRALIDYSPARCARSPLPDAGAPGAHRIAAGVHATCGEAPDLARLLGGSDGFSHPCPCANPFVINPNMSAPGVSALLQRHVQAAAGSQRGGAHGHGPLCAPYIAVRRATRAAHAAPPMCAHEIAAAATRPARRGADRLLGDPGLMALRESQPQSPSPAC